MLMIALSLLAAEPPPATVEVVQDPITDRIRAAAIFREDGHRLVVSCDPARYEGARIVVHSRRWLARGNRLTGVRPLVYRFDSQRPRRHLWKIEDRRATLSRQSRVRSFLDHLAVSERLVIRARDIEDRRFHMIFPLPDVQPAVERAMAACAADSERPSLAPEDISD